jgi:hypothetical protein
MDLQAIIEYVKGWGYRTLPEHHAGSPGHPGLIVAIREKPTRQHYDPYRLQLYLRDVDGRATWRTLSWLTPTAKSDRFCPGPIILHDRHGKEAEFFAFGGTLRTTSRETEWIYVLQSAAPILELTEDEETLSDQLASEVEELMAEAKARWQGDDEGFDKRLGNVDPVQLYTSALFTLLERFQHSRAMMASYAALAELLENEKEWLVQQHVWPAAPPRVKDLLSPQS